MQGAVRGRAAPEGCLQRGRKLSVKPGQFQSAGCSDCRNHSRLSSISNNVKRYS